MSPTIADGPDGLRALIGTELGPTDWEPITQERVNAFADATGDHQWIHVDVERARRESPYGAPIAHGYLTLSLIPMLVPQLLDATGFAMGVNYGSDRVRFPAAVPVGSRVRATMVVDSVTDVPGGVQMAATVTVAIEGGAKPACVATVLSRRLL